MRFFFFFSNFHSILAITDFWECLWFQRYIIYLDLKESMYKIMINKSLNFIMNPSYLECSQMTSLVIYLLISKESSHFMEVL